MMIQASARGPVGQDQAEQNANCLAKDLLQGWRDSGRPITKPDVTRVLEELFHKPWRKQIFTSPGVNQSNKKQSPFQKPFKGLLKAFKKPLKGV